MPVEQANAVLAAVDPPTAAPVFAHMLPTYAAQCVELQLPADGALLLETARQPGGRRDPPPSRARHARAPCSTRSARSGCWRSSCCLSYPSNTVGAWVEPRVLTLPDDCNAGEARERIATQRRCPRKRASTFSTARGEFAARSVVYRCCRCRAAAR